MRDWKVKLGQLLNALELIPIAAFTPLDSAGAAAEHPH